VVAFRYEHDGQYDEKLFGLGGLPIRWLGVILLLNGW